MSKSDFELDERFIGDILELNPILKAVSDMNIGELPEGLNVFAVYWGF